MMNDKHLMLYNLKMPEVYRFDILVVINLYARIFILILLYFILLQVV